MSDGPILGIDLGTTNSVVAVADGGEARVLADDEGRRMVPSVVSFQPDGPPLVGYAAREQRLLDARNTVYAVKRLIGRPFESPEVARARERFAFEIVPNKHGGSVVEVSRGTYALAEISAMVLRELRRIAEAALGESAERAVITVPANFNELQRSATKAAGKVAGLDVLRILNEPTAAALAYGYTAGQSERVAVYDLGGGTFDITILELEDDVFEVLSTAGDTFLGGEDMDRNIAEVMCDAFRAEHGVDLRRDAQAFERVKAAAEWAKCQLSSDEAVELTVEEITTARGASLDLTFAMTRAELEALATPWLDRSFQVSEEALGVAGLSIADLDRVVLVGGSTRMPLCRQRVAEFFGREPRTDLDPDLVVAQGAAIHGFALGGPREARVLRPTPAGRPVVRKPTAVGMPRQPAFAPDEQGVAAPRPPRRPARSTAPPPPVPDLPPTPPADPVLVSRSVAVRTPRTTLDTTLDALAPPDDDLGELDDLAPTPFPSADPFADVAPDHPFASPHGALPMPELDLALDPVGPHAPGEKPVPSREPTVPFAVEKHAPPRKRPPPPPPRPAAQRAAPPAPPAAQFDAPRPSFAEAIGTLEAPSVPPVLTIGVPTTAAREPAQAFAIAPTQPVVALPDRPPPLLMDVTPHSLGLATAGGYCRRIIGKNAPVPTEQVRTFTTARDDQLEVIVRICQGEHEQFEQNEILGEIVLDQLPPRRRGETKIDVAFILDADGTLAVEARDTGTGRVTRTRIALRGGLSTEEIEAMRARHEQELG